MNRTLKFSIGLSAVLILLVGTFLAVGLMQDTNYEASISELIPAPKEEIWKYITNVEDVPNRRNDVVSVEILEKDDTSIPLLWKENTSMGGYMIFKRGETIPFAKMEIVLQESSFKIKGSWVYELEEKNGDTIFSVTEKSEIASPVARGAFYFAGRDSTIQQELTMVRNYFRGRR
ncbi:SRPBCC family protein [Leptospira idonii]|uniref:SRPBCC family protein n=1 Tax=Leptospira idonii TaxID=1193500 RepID=A0A4R9LW08_9LEPT|nr:SRPBCC family protein [Leptospira idonii]TGN17087.1 SRPBCC family protein [Leptospira idonii]